MFSFIIRYQNESVANPQQESIRSESQEILPSGLKLESLRNLRGLVIESIKSPLNIEPYHIDNPKNLPSIGRGDRRNSQNAFESRMEDSRKLWYLLRSGKIMEHPEVLNKFKLPASVLQAIQNQLANPKLQENTPITNTEAEAPVTSANIETQATPSANPFRDAINPNNYPRTNPPTPNRTARPNRQENSTESQSVNNNYNGAFTPSIEFGISGVLKLEIIESLRERSFDRNPLRADLASNRFPRSISFDNGGRLIFNGQTDIQSSDYTFISINQKPAIKFGYQGRVYSLPINTQSLTYGKNKYTLEGYEEL
jgi:hypothetical protein